MHRADSEFDGRLLEAVAAGEGGAGLSGTPALARLMRALEEDDEDRRKMEEEQAAAAAVAGEGGQGGGGSGDPFEGVPEVAAGDEELIREYGDAMADLVHTQVTCGLPVRCLCVVCFAFSPGFVVLRAVGPFNSTLSSARNFAESIVDCGASV